MLKICRLEFTRQSTVNILDIMASRESLLPAPASKLYNHFCSIFIPFQTIQWTQRDTLIVHLVLGVVCCGGRGCRSKVRWLAIIIVRSSGFMGPAAVERERERESRF